MDNLTHSLVGWALAETGLKNRTRKGLAACVLGANMPDIDVFFGWAPWAPLAMHRGFTHGLVGGVLLMPPLLAGLLWLLDRWQARRGAIFRSGLPMHAGWLVALCYLGALTHPLLDLQNTYAVQLMSPASERWFHTDGLFIIDAVVWLMLGLGIWLARKRGRAGRRSSGRPAQAAFAGTVAYILLNVGISQAAGSYVRGIAFEPMEGRPIPEATRIFAAPEPLAFWKRDVIVRWDAGGTITYQHIAYDPLARGPRPASPHVSANITDPLVRRAIASSADLRDFLAWSQMPFARLERQGCSAVVTVGDARFAGPRMVGSFTRRVEVPAC
jgi:inner membrane protein